MHISQGSFVEPLWLTAEDILGLNADVVADSGEEHLILSHDLLGGAVARPQNLFVYEGCLDIITLGVRLTEAICRNHCFGQGNKRTGFHAGIIFMELNDAFIDLKDWESNAELITGLVAGIVEAREIEDAYRKRLWSPISI